MASLQGLQTFLSELDKGQKRLNEAIQAAKTAKQEQFQREITLAERGLGLDENRNLIKIAPENNPVLQGMLEKRAAFDPNFLVKDGNLIVDPNSELGQNIKIRQADFELRQETQGLRNQLNQLEVNFRAETDPIKKEQLRLAIEKTKNDFDFNLKLQPLLLGQQQTATELDKQKLQEFIEQKPLRDKEKRLELANLENKIQSGQILNKQDQERLKFLQETLSSRVKQQKAKAQKEEIDVKAAKARFNEFLSGRPFRDEQRKLSLTELKQKVDRGELINREQEIELAIAKVTAPLRIRELENKIERGKTLNEQERVELEFLKQTFPLRFRIQEARTLQEEAKAEILPKQLQTQLDIAKQELKKQKIQTKSIEDTIDNVIKEKQIDVDTKIAKLEELRTSIQERKNTSEIRKKLQIAKLRSIEVDLQERLNQISGETGEPVTDINTRLSQQKKAFDALIKASENPSITDEEAQGLVQVAKQIAENMASLALQNTNNRQQSQQSEQQTQQSISENQPIDNTAPATSEQLDKIVEALKKLNLTEEQIRRQLSGRIPDKQIDGIIIRLNAGK